MKYRVSLLIRINIYARILCINIVSFIINVYSLVTCMIFTWQIVMFKPEFICFFRMLRNISSGLYTCPQCQENTDVTAHLQNWSGAQRLSSLLHTTQFRRVLKLHCWVSISLSWWEALSQCFLHRQGNASESAFVECRSRLLLQAEQCLQW